MTSKNGIAFLLVTCCLEQSRAKILSDVVDNLTSEAPELREIMTVFDNASSEPGVIDLLTKSYLHVYQADRNVGYWSAVDWWLTSIFDTSPKYTYIIESDMMHYGFNKLWSCASYLNDHHDHGSVRLHEYSINDRHLYDKDKPRNDSRKNLWQSHHNKVTNKPITFDRSSGDIWSTTFLTQLPALNRYDTMHSVFKELRSLQQFTELDFQSHYWQRYSRTGILDGGIYHCNMNPYGAKVITGSWTTPQELQRIGYQQTRHASIVPHDQYNVVRLN